LHVRSEKLVSALTELHGAREQLFGVQKLVAVGTLAAGAAHDFNNTLTTVLGHADLALGDRTLPPSVREDIEAIRQAAKGAATLTDNLLGIARKQGRRSGYADLAEAVRAPLDTLAREFDRQHIRVVTRFEPVRTPPGDYSLLYQVFLNLYLNARDAMIPKGGGVLSVSLRAASPGVEVAVSDTGGGIPEAFRSRIFQPLQTTKGTAGTGLGLSVSKSVVESMGGRIRYETSEGEGTTFYVTFPVAAD
jgi:two-component system cell cycle sensor histidine kinase/response regulator CckA